MRRQDRLLELIGLLRDGQTHRGEDLARALGVSVRTLYRDMDTLAASGVAVEGERGSGYRMTAPVTLPPLNLTMDELEALQLGLAILGEAGEPGMRDAARALAAKVDAALPEENAVPPAGWGLATYPFADATRGFRHLADLRAAIRARQKLEIARRTGSGAHVTSTIRPLALEFWGRIWTLTAWCESAEDFLVVRLDQIAGLTVLPDLFVDEPGKRLADHRRHRP